MDKYIEFVNCKHWLYFVKKQFANKNLVEFCNLSAPLSNHLIVDHAEQSEPVKYVTEWSSSINIVTGTSERGRNKFRTYYTLHLIFGMRNTC